MPDEIILTVDDAAPIELSVDAGENVPLGITESLLAMLNAAIYVNGETLYIIAAADANEEEY